MRIRYFILKFVQVCEAPSARSICGISFLGAVRLLIAYCWVKRPLLEKWFLRSVKPASSLKIACWRPPDAALRPALTARACTRTPSSRACRCAQSMRSWCCSSAALRPHRSPASPPSVLPLPPAPPPADAVVRALSGARPRGGGSSVRPGRAARLEDDTPTRVPILSFCSFLPVSRLCRETAECVPS